MLLGKLHKIERLKCEPKLTASNNDFKFSLQMAPVSMETKLLYDIRFIFLTLRILRLFRRFDQIAVGYKSNFVIIAGLPYEVQTFEQSFVNQTYKDMYVIVQWL